MRQALAQLSQALKLLEQRGKDVGVPVPAPARMQSKTQPLLPLQQIRGSGFGDNRTAGRPTLPVRVTEAGNQSSCKVAKNDGNEEANQNVERNKFRVVACNCAKRVTMVSYSWLGAPSFISKSKK